MWGMQDHNKTFRIALAKKVVETFTQLDFSNIPISGSFEPEIFFKEQFHVYMCRFGVCVFVCVCVCVCVCVFVCAFMCMD